MKLTDLHDTIRRLDEKYTLIRSNEQVPIAVRHKAQKILDGYFLEALGDLRAGRMDNLRTDLQAATCYITEIRPIFRFA